MGRLFLGLDSSTQSLSAVVIDLDARKVVYEKSLNYDQALPQYEPAVLDNPKAASPGSLGYTVGCPSAVAAGATAFAVETGIDIWTGAILFNPATQERMKVTIRDVAARAGVSAMAVSAVLHGTGKNVKISEEKAQKIRDAAVIQRLASDPHSPHQWRSIMPLRNIDAWYAAFDVQPGQTRYLPPDQRVRIW